MGLKGVDERGLTPFERSAFRTSYFQPEGAVPPVIQEARIIDVNLVNWTVDCTSVFDQKTFLDVQVGAPYLHHNTGEGMYAVPEVGAKCVLCIPSDGPPPFVLAFLMPIERIDTSDNEEVADNRTYKGGRPPAKMGDIYLRGRDGNFCVLHRGGVLQIGSTELAQRIYIPLSNLVTDISQNYHHYNTAGSISWGVRPGSPEENPETSYLHTFRVFANDEFADVRVSIGQEYNPAIEPDGDDGASSDMNQLGVNTEEKINLEFLLAPGGFSSNGSFGSGVDSRDVVKLRFLVDRGGNVLFRSEGSVAVRVKERFRIRVDEDFDVYSKGNITIEAENVVRLASGGLLELATDGGIVKLNAGTKPVAHVGSQILITTVVPIPIMTSVGPGTILAGAVFSGNVLTGNPTILV